MEILDWLLVVPLGLLAGGLAGLLGIGGGLIFAPLLLWMGLTPHQALASNATTTRHSKPTVSQTP